jgi:ADP-heptose:LPS heptosyltransferase
MRSSLPAERARVWAGAANMLCVRLDNMGDVLMTTPALRALKSMPLPASKAAGQRRLTLLASESGAAVARHIPEIDAVLTYHAPWMKSSSPHPAAVDRAFIRNLARRRFDAAVIFACYSQRPLPAALLCTLAGIPLVLAHCRENPYALLSDWIREREPESGVRHEVERQLDLVGEIGARTADTRLSFRTTRQDIATLHDKLDELRVGKNPVFAGATRSYMVLHPGATAPSRRYAAERFAVAARELVQDFHLPILITGASGERKLAQRIAAGAGAGAVNVAGMLTLGELGALIEGAALLVSNNTGPVHLAAALRTPVVDLYALTNPQHTPWQVPHRVLNRDVPCRDCYKSICPQGESACLNVESHEIVAAARALAREQPERGTTRHRSTDPLPCIPSA